VPEVTGDAAIGVDPRSIRQITEAIESVLGDVEVAERFARRARARSERFSWDETARLTLQVYEDVRGTK
jgi:glycosyltransferase involved in cell wall biosynthesis